jgi:hypothetical protein
MEGEVLHVDDPLRAEMEKAVNVVSLAGSMHR